jgi:hypothetical protein
MQALNVMMPPNNERSISPDHHDNSSVDRFGENHFHLPLHVHSQLEAPSTQHSDADSDCTNPRLKYLMDRYFQSNDEGIEFDADGESEAEVISCMRQKPRKKSRRRKKGTGYTTRKPIPLQNDSVLLDGVEQALSYSPQDQGRNIEPSCTQFHTPTYKSKVVDQKVDVVSGKIKEVDKPPFRTVVQRYNAWDSSPSTVADEDDHNTSVSFDMYFNPIDDDQNGDGPSINVRKHLFSEGGIGYMNNDFTVPEGNFVKDIELTDDSDLELTQRSRQIQYDLRLQEMSELALEAERAAEAGKEKFVGNATKFELGLGLDVGGGKNSPVRSPPRGIGRRSWSVWDNFDSSRPDYDAVTPLRGHHRNLNSHDQPLTIRPSTEIKKPKAISHGSRQVSAPSKLQSKNSAKSTIPRILTSATFLSVAPPSEAKEKIPVLALRHIEEVIPPFKEMHPLVKTNLSRCGVNATLSSKALTDSSISVQSRRGSAPSVSFITRVPSFRIIMKSMSGLSGTGKSIKAYKSDEEISDDAKAEADSDLSLGPDDMALDCVSFVSCGDINEDILVTPEKKTKVCSNDETLRSLPSDLYACTLATELHDPLQEKRSVSPLPKAPYSMDSDNNLKITPQRACASPRSRWSTFWEKISPAKTSRSPLRIQLNRHSWSFAGNNGLVEPATVHKRITSSSDSEDMRYESSLYFNRMLAKQNGAHASWEVQKDESSNGVIISSQSFSQRIQRTQSPPWLDGNCDSYDITEDVAKHSKVINTREAAFDDEQHAPGTDKKTSFSNHNSKGSFRTSTTTQMSCDESSICSKFSEASQPSHMISTKRSLTGPHLLTIRPFETACASSVPSTLADIQIVHSCSREQETMPYKPPLHPLVGIKLSDTSLLNTNNRKYQHLDSVMNVESHMLPTIEASISCPDRSEASSVLSTTSEDEHLSFAVDDSTNAQVEDMLVRPFETACASSLPSTLAETNIVHSCSREQETMSHKLPFHPPVGIKLSDTSLLNTDNRKYQHLDSVMNVESHMLPTIEASISCPDFSEASSVLNTTSEDEHLSFVVDKSTNVQAEDILFPIGNTNINESSMQSMCNLWRKEASLVVASNDLHDAKSELFSDLESKRKNDEHRLVSFDALDDASIVSDDDENNKSTISFIDLIEKVPSVINSFRPFKTSKKPESIYQDDIAFVENYFFTGIKPKEAKGRVKTDHKPQSKHFFGKDACLDLNCISVMESALTYLSAESPRNTSSHVVNRKFLSENGKYGRLDNNRREKKLIVGGRLFKTPSLMDSKQSVLDEQIGQSFESNSMDA